jgi:hypothetical protein
MIQDFKQCWVSQHGVQFFEDAFKLTWNLDLYHDNTAPAVFFGMYHPDDVIKMANHKGPKIIIWGGNDMQPAQLHYVSNLQKTQEIYSWAYPGEFSDVLTRYNIKHKQLYVALKDYSRYTPSMLGENIYVYKGIHGNRHDHYKWHEVVPPLIEVFGKDRITFTNHLSMDALIENIYKKCFVYIKPNPKGGCTTMFELGHMGIRTLGNNHKNLDCFSDYQNDIYKLIELIVEESKYIGKIRNDISESTTNIFAEGEWLTLNFWDK